MDCSCMYCCKREYEYSDELQDRRPPTKSRCNRKRKCCCACVVIVVLISSIIAAVPHVKDKIRCTYYDTSSEDLGNPNFYLSCGAEKSDCAFYGYEYNASYYNTDCCKDKKVHLCVYPHHPPAPPPTPANHLQLVSWNVFERPAYVAQDGQVERTCYIPRWVAQHYPEADVITFQELFTDGCWGDRSSVRAMLKSHGYLYSSRPVEAEMHLHTAGVFLASKWPIEHQESLVFGYANIATIKNYHIPKGAVYARVRKKVGTQQLVYHLVGLHLFSNRGSLNAKARIHQAKELADLLQKQNISKSEPVIISGDFNQDFHAQHEELEEVLKTLSLVLCRNISSLPYSFDRMTNELNIEANPGHWPSEWIDYITYRSDHRAPKMATLDCVRAQAEVNVSTCWCENCKTLGVSYIPRKPNCDEVRNFTDLSDHYPVIGTFEF